MKYWTETVFNTPKPIIGMCHFQAMPGDPYYDKDGGMEKVLEAARHDFLALQNGGIDGVIFSNEFSLPYLTKAHTETVACMARVIGELKAEIKIPFGVNVLWDPVASLDLAVATDAQFVREIFTGVYASDFGLWNTNVGETIRHQRAIGAEKVKLLYNIVPESAKYLVDRDIVQIAVSTVFNNRPDALCVSGLVAGNATDLNTLRDVKRAVPDTVVFANTGCTIDTIEQQLTYADGAVVGTTFKKDGVFENSADQNRVTEFMDKVKAFRESLNR